MKKNRVERGGSVQGGVGDERKLEIACCTYARQKGIIAVKLEKNAHKGIPDYMFIAEGGSTMFVEFKRPDGRGVVSNEQNYWAEFLGYSHKFIDNFEDFKERLDNFLVLGENKCVEVRSITDSNMKRAEYSTELKLKHKLKSKMLWKT